MAICKLCNHENPDGMQFCANCGNALEVSATPAASASDVDAGATSEAASSASDKKEEILTPVTTGTIPTSTTGSITPPPAETLAPVALVPTAPAAGQQGGTYSASQGGASAQGQAPQPQPYVASQGPNSQYYEPANTVPFNAKDQAAYQQQLLRGNRPDYENVCVLALVFGILGFFLNPLYLVSVAAIVLGIIGHANNGSKKTLGMVGWILGLSALVVQLFFDFMCAATTCGIGSIAICF
ncbi:MAG: zinc ribbon domain-containing protein [Clostridiales bacterium]|nr:zinc ribbon domain-containing protein [Clostridiales bacterium]